MRAIVLAAGQGTRLRPHTDDRPKCMVELAGQPLLHRQLQTLRGAGITRVAVVGGYCADALAAPGVERIDNPRFADTNMVATLFCAESFMRDDEDLVIAYGDIVYEPRVLRALLEVDAPIVVAIDREWRRYWAIRMDDPLADAETLRLGADGRIVELGKKPRGYEEIEGQYIGLIKVRSDHVARFRDAWHGLDRAVRYDGRPFEQMYMTSFLQHLIDSGWLVQPAPIDNGWLEVDTVEDLDRYHAMLRDGSLARFIHLQD